MVIGKAYDPIYLPRRKETQYTLYIRLGGPRWRCGSLGQEKENALMCPVPKPDRPVHSLVTISTLSRLPKYLLELGGGDLKKLCLKKEPDRTCRLFLCSVCRELSFGSSVNPLTPNDTYRGRTATLTSKVAFYIFIQQI